MTKCPKCKFYSICCGRLNETVENCVRFKSVEQTNEEWFDTLSTTEEKAEAIYECVMANSWSFSKDGIKRWLKQPHTEKE